MGLGVYKRFSPTRVTAPARLTDGATTLSETEVGFSDPVSSNGLGTAQRIKDTLGITG